MFAQQPMTSSSLQEPADWSLWEAHGSGLEASLCVFPLELENCPNGVWEEGRKSNVENLRNSEDMDMAALAHKHRLLFAHRREVMGAAIVPASAVPSISSLRRAVAYLSLSL